MMVTNNQGCRRVFNSQQPLAQKRAVRWIGTIFLSLETGRSCVPLTELLLQAEIVPAVQMERCLLPPSLMVCVLCKMSLTEWLSELTNLHGPVPCKRGLAELVAKLISLHVKLKKVKMGVLIWCLKEEVMVVPAADVCTTPVFSLYFFFVS